MPKSSTSFTKQTAPKAVKGRKSVKRKIKESLGIDSWENLCEFIKTDGADKAKTEISKLKTTRYLYAYMQLLEFVKPKLQRNTLVGDKDEPIEITINGQKPGAL